MATVAVDQVTYEDLYERWERSNWRATEIDFTQDRVEWHERFSELERRAALWNYAMFFHGEDAVTDDLSPFIDAAPREEQKYFLATQQVDEARHAVFFNRFMHEVVERGDGTIASALEATRPELTWGFVKTFEMLHRVVDELRRDRSRTKLAQAVTMYHFVVEATLAQPGQHFISDYLAARDVLPGFRAGMRNVALDEQRHIGFGVKLLRDLAAEDPEVPDAVADQLRAVTPISLAVFVPPGWDTRYVECFGFTLEQVYEEGARSFEAKFRAAGMPIESLPGPSIMPMDMPPRQRAERGLAMLRAGYLGERNGPPARDPEAMAVLFDSIRRSVDPAPRARRAARPAVGVLRRRAVARSSRQRRDRGGAGPRTARRRRAALQVRRLGRRGRRPARPARRGRHRPPAAAREAADAVARPRPVQRLTVSVIRHLVGVLRAEERVLAGLGELLRGPRPARLERRVELHRALADVDVVGLEGELLPLEPDACSPVFTVSLPGAKKFDADLGVVDAGALARLGRPGDQERRSRRHDGDGSDGGTERAHHDVTVTVPFISAPWTMQ